MSSSWGSPQPRGCTSNSCIGRGFSTTSTTWEVHSVLGLAAQSSLTLQLHRLWPARLLCPWGFFRQEYWSGWPFPSPGDLPKPGIGPRSPNLQENSLPSEPPGKPKNAGCCCCCSSVASVVSDSLQPRRRQPTRLPHPWDSPGKNPGLGCHFLLQCMKVKSEGEVTQSYPTPRDPMDCSLPGSSIRNTGVGSISLL